MWAWKLICEVKPNLGRTSMTRFDNYQKIFQDRKYFAQFAAWKHQQPSRLMGKKVRHCDQVFQAFLEWRCNRQVFKVCNLDHLVDRCLCHNDFNSHNVGRCLKVGGVGCGWLWICFWGFPFMGISLRDLKNLHFLLRWEGIMGDLCQPVSFWTFFFCVCSLPHPRCRSGFSNSIIFFSHDEESVIYVAIKISMIIWLQLR